MKELQQHITIKVEVQKQVLKQRAFIGSLLPKPRQVVWEFNTKTGTIEHAVIDEVSCAINGSLIKKINVKDNCLYCVAINKNNAERKFLKLFAVK